MQTLPTRKRKAQTVANWAHFNWFLQHCKPTTVLWANKFVGAYALRLKNGFAVTFMPNYANNAGFINSLYVTVNGKSRWFNTPLAMAKFLAKIAYGPVCYPIAGARGQNCAARSLLRMVFFASWQK